MPDQKDQPQSSGEEAPEIDAPEEGEDAREGGPQMPFLAHLEELRTRLIRAALAVAVCFAGTYAFKEEIYGFLTVPLKAVMPEGAKLIYTAPAEAFFTYLKVAFLAAAVAASPAIFYQLWRFISPGLYEKERKMIWPFVAVSSILFIGGAIFCYMVVFPFAFTFFMSFATPDITPMLKLNEYLSFSAMLLFAFGVVFEMPLVLVFLGRLGVVSAAGLRKSRKFAILIMFVGAAIITPPDVISQIMMAVPLMVLYEISVLMVAASEKKKAERQAAEEAEFESADE